MFGLIYEENLSTSECGKKPYNETIFRDGNLGRNSYRIPVLRNYFERLMMIFDRVPVKNWILNEGEFQE